ncbi:MAG: ComEC/Rec2 family competence protein [Brevinematales bacterium]|nr:ComEC/Rec2 family competence protein [Brevinematales bacterium]
MIYLLSVFVSLLIGSGLGVYFTTYHFPEMPSMEVVKNFPMALSLFLVTTTTSVVLKSRKLLLLSVIFTTVFVSFCYSAINSKKRLDSMLKTPNQSFVSGTVSISFLNKVFVSVSNYNVIVYLRNYDYEFSSIGAQVVISGNSRHIYTYLTNKNMYGYFLYLFKENTPYIIYSKDDIVGEVVESSSLFLRLVNIVRQDIYNKFYSYIPHTSFLSASLIMGETSEISREFMEKIKDSGISHIFSVSGFHVGVIVIAFVILLNVLRIPKLIQFVVISVFLVGYSLIVGLKPPVVRSSLLASIMLLIRSFNLRPNYLSTTLVVGIIMLALNPFLSVDVGFILSFFAIISTILFSRYIDEIVVSVINRYGFEPNRTLKGIISLLSVSFTAVMFTLPVILIWFGSSSLVGILSSIVLVPLSSLNITSGIISYIFSSVSGTIAEYMFRGVNFINLIFIIITEYFSTINLQVGIVFSNFTETLVFVVLYYFILIAIYAYIPNKNVVHAMFKMKVTKQTT